ncbi:MAG TPA: S9 family peptidase [Lysobacter sp.]|nr:S9 family peptidase [Lysobacter sp.]
MKPVTPDDLYQHRHLQDISGVTEHGRVAFVVSRASKRKGGYRSTAWLIDTASTRRARQLTSAQFNAQSVVVDPAAERVAFVSQRQDDDSPQVYLIATDGGEARALTRADGGIASLLAWSQDGGRLLALQSFKWKEDGRDDPDAQSRPLVVRFLPYKMDGSGPKVGERTRLVSIDAASGEVTTLVEGDFDVSDAMWSPDGATLAFSRKRSGLQRHQADLWLAKGDGSDARQVTHDLYSVSGLRFSPDGKRLAFGAGTIEGESLVALFVYDVESGEKHSPKGDDLQLEGATLVWHPDGDRIATIASRNGLFEIAVLHVDSGGVTPLEGGLRHVTALAPSGDGLVFVASTLRELDEVFRVDWDGRNEKRLTPFNRTWFGQRIRPRVSKRSFEVPDAKGGTERIEAWIMLPPEGDGPFPTLVDFHGGPESITLIDFASHLYWYPLIAKGYAVIAPNPVGSGGYGGEFARRLIGHWGEYDLPQVEAVLTQLRSERVVGEALGCYGKSYGGYLSAWTAANSDMFKAAVVSAPVANLQSHGGTSDTGYYVTPYAMGADLHESAEQYARLSPVEHAAKIDTATLFLNGQDDQRCPVGQCEEMFANVIRAGHPNAMMVVYPGGSHSLAGSGRPAHRVDYHGRVVDWIDRHV